MRNKLSGKMSSFRGLDGNIVHIARENTLFEGSYTQENAASL
jgi:hypothetical protein